MRSLQHPRRQDIKLTRVLHALSDPLRLNIIQQLAGCEEEPCSHLCNTTPKSTLSHHFKTLREAGLIHQRCEGTSCLNSLRREDLNARFPGLLDSILHVNEKN